MVWTSPLMLVYRKAFFLSKMHLKTYRIIALIMRMNLVPSMLKLIDK